MPKLIVEKGRNKGTTLALEPGKPYILGRSDQVSMTLLDPQASRQHVEVRVDNGSIKVKDLNSSNGTLLNGTALVGGAVNDAKPGDSIQVGEMVLSILPDEQTSKSGGLIGKTVGGYRVEERIGRGGMGTVYKATQLSLNRTVALKILAAEYMKDPAFVEQFVAEARAAGQLNHPHIVQVYDVGSDKGLYYFSMEYAEKGSLGEQVQGGKRLEPKEATRAILDIAKALEFAQRHGIVHQDIKPDNMMVNADGVVKLGDLGLARHQSETGKDEVFGSPSYIAPEQAQGLAIDFRADLYALGGSYYRLITGERTHTGNSVPEIIQKQIDNDPQPVKSLAPETPQPIVDLIDQLLLKDPAARAASTREVVERLEDLLLRLDTNTLGDSRVGAAGVAGGEVRPPWKDWVVPGTLVLVLILMISVGVSMMNGDETPTPTESTAVSTPVDDPTPIRTRPNRSPRATASGAESTKTPTDDARRREADALLALQELDAKRDVTDPPLSLEMRIQLYNEFALTWEGTSSAARALEQVELDKLKLEQRNARRAELTTEWAALAAEIDTDIAEHRFARNRANAVRMQGRARDAELVGLADTIGLKLVAIDDAVAAAWNTLEGTIATARQAARDARDPDALRNVTGLLAPAINMWEVVVYKERAQALARAIDVEADELVAELIRARKEAEEADLAAIDKAITESIQKFVDGFDLKAMLLAWKTVERGLKCDAYAKPVGLKVRNIQRMVDWHTKMIDKIVAAKSRPISISAPEQYKALSDNGRIELIRPEWEQVFYKLKRGSTGRKFTDMNSNEYRDVLGGVMRGEAYHFAAGLHAFERAEYAAAIDLIDDAFKSGKLTDEESTDAREVMASALILEAERLVNEGADGNGVKALALLDRLRKQFSDTFTYKQNTDGR
jgi:hypothetical protein